MSFFLTCLALDMLKSSLLSLILGNLFSLFLNMFVVFLKHFVFSLPSETPIILMSSFHTQYFPLILFSKIIFKKKKNTYFNLATPVPSYGTQDLLSWHAESLVVALGIYFLNQGSKLGPLYRTCGVLATGPLGRSLHLILFPRFFWVHTTQYPPSVSSFLEHLIH